MQSQVTAIEKAHELSQLGKNEEALKYFDIAIKEDPNFTLAHVYKAEVLRELGRDEEALACFDKLEDLECDEHTAWGFYKRAILLYKLGKGVEALTNLDKVLEIDPNYVNAYFSKGVIWGDYYKITRKTKAFKDAIRCYDEATRINPIDWGALYNKGLLLEEDYKEAEAMACFDKVIEIDPNNDQAISSKGRIFLTRGKYQDAIDCFDIAIKINPKEADTMYNKAKSLYLQDKAEEAHIWLKKALKLKPDLPDSPELLDMLEDRIEFNCNIHNSCKLDHD